MIYKYYIMLGSVAKFVMIVCFIIPGKTVLSFSPSKYVKAKLVLPLEMPTPTCTTIPAQEKNILVLSSRRFNAQYAVHVKGKAC